MQILYITLTGMFLSFVVVGVLVIAAWMESRDVKKKLQAQLLPFGAMNVDDSLELEIETFSARESLKFTGIRFLAWLILWTVAIGPIFIWITLRSDGIVRLILLGSNVILIYVFGYVAFNLLSLTLNAIKCYGQMIGVYESGILLSFWEKSVFIAWEDLVGIEPGTSLLHFHTLTLANGRELMFSSALHNSIILVAYIGEMVRAPESRGKERAANGGSGS